MEIENVYKREGAQSSFQRLKWGTVLSRDLGFHRPKEGTKLAVTIKKVDQTTNRRYGTGERKGKEILRGEGLLL